MKGLSLFATLAIIALVLCPFSLAYAGSEEGSATKHEGSAMKQEGSGAQHEGSMMKEAEETPSKPPYCKPKACMNIMLKTQEDREQIVDEILKDEATRELLLEKIAADSSMCDKLMKKMKEKKQGEGSMMKHEEMEHGQGSMMKHEGSASKE